MKVQSIIEDVLIGSGIVVSMIDIQQFLSIILLVFNVMWILVKFGFKVYEHFKNKEYKKVVDDIEHTKDELEQLTGKDSNKDK